MAESSKGIIMKPWILWAIALVVLACIPARASVDEKEKAIYEHMKNHGVTLDDVAALKRVYDEKNPVGQKEKPAFRDLNCAARCPDITLQEKKAAVDALYGHIQHHGIYDLPDEPSDKETDTRRNPSRRKIERIQKKIEDIRNELKFRDPTLEDISAIKRLQEAEIYAIMRYYGIGAKHVAVLKRLYEPSPDDARIHLSDREQEAAIYKHMKRYGINRDDVAALGRLWLSDKSHVMVSTNDLLAPGEYYRMEMDEYILTMKIPDAERSSGQKIWPYTDTRTPDPLTGKMFGRMDKVLKIADLAFYIRPSFIFGRTNNLWGGGIYYQILTDRNQYAYLTPETVREHFSVSQKSQVLTQEEIERSLRRNLIDNRMGNKIALAPELVTINGRIWIREAMDRYGSDRRYQYTTVLKPDRRLHLSLEVPDNRAAYEKMEEMVASIRVAKIDDDGSPDPFVIERVEPAPLPVREPLPSSRQ
jgi:hypothetical protein